MSSAHPVIYLGHEKGLVPSQGNIIDAEFVVVDEEPRQLEVDREPRLDPIPGGFRPNWAAQEQMRRAGEAGRQDPPMGNWAGVDLGQGRKASSTKNWWAVATAGLFGLLGVLLNWGRKAFGWSVSKTANLGRKGVASARKGGGNALLFVLAVVAVVATAWAGWVAGQEVYTWFYNNISWPNGAKVGDSNYVVIALCVLMTMAVLAVGTLIVATFLTGVAWVLLVIWNFIFTVAGWFGHKPSETGLMRKHYIPESWAGRLKAIWTKGGNIATGGAKLYVKYIWYSLLGIALITAVLFIGSWVEAFFKHYFN